MTYTILVPSHNLKLFVLVVKDSMGIFLAAFRFFLVTYESGHIYNADLLFSMRAKIQVARVNNTLAEA